MPSFAAFEDLATAFQSGDERERGLVPNRSRHRVVGGTGGARVERLCRRAATRRLGAVLQPSSRRPGSVAHALRVSGAAAGVTPKRPCPAGDQLPAATRYRPFRDQQRSQGAITHAGQQLAVHPRLPRAPSRHDRSNHTAGGRTRHLPATTCQRRRNAPLQRGFSKALEITVRSLVAHWDRTVRSSRARI
jgi:hypothetical protein